MREKRTQFAVLAAKVEKSVAAHVRTAALVIGPKVSMTTFTHTGCKRVTSGSSCLSWTWQPTSPLRLCTNLCGVACKRSDSWMQHHGASHVQMFGKNEGKSSKGVIMCVNCEI